MDTTKDIYIVNDELIEFLQKEKKMDKISYEFYHIKANAMKIKFIEKVLCQYKRIPILVLRRSKDNAYAKAMRLKGNHMFQQGDDKMFRAMKLYNESICFAETGSEDLGIGYANRSAVYFKWRMHDACLKNILLAKNSAYPKNLMDKLMKREADCIALKNMATEDDNTLSFGPMLSFKPHPDVPYIGDLLSVKKNIEFGRYVVTNQDVKAGQILAVEEPFLTIILPELRYQRCTHCLRESQMNLLPCKGCTSAMFCSSECYDKAHSSYHRFECPLIDYLLALFNKIHLSAIRATIMTILSFGTVEKLQNFIQESGDREVNVFTTETEDNPMPNYETPEQKSCHQIYSFPTNESKRSTSDLFQRAVIAAVAYHQLIRHTPLADECKDNENSQNTLLEILFRYLQISPTSFHSMSIIDVGQPSVQYGCGAYPFATLLNHSCAPNILRFSYDRKMVIMASRALKAGEQLFDNYG